MSGRRGSLPLRRRLSFAALITLGLLLSAELLLRLVYGAPNEVANVFKAISYPDGSWFAVDATGVSTTYVNLDPIAPFPRRSGRPRVAVLGGSTTHGGSINLPRKREFPQLVERATGYTTLNLASPGLDSFDSVGIAQELFESEVDLLVIYDGHNDFGNMYFQERFGTAGSGVEARLRALLDRSQVFTQLHRALGGPDGRPRMVGPRVGATPLITPARMAAALKAFELNLNRLCDLAEAHRAGVVLITPASSVFRRPYDRNPGPEGAWAAFEQGVALRGRDPVQAGALLTAARDRDTIPLRAPTAAIEVVRRVAVERGVTLVDADRDLPREPLMLVVEGALMPDGIHFTQQGHEEMAKLLAPVVKAALEARARPGGPRP